MSQNQPGRARRPAGATGLAFLEDPKTAELLANLIPSKSDRKQPVQIEERKGLEGQ